MPIYLKCDELLWQEKQEEDEETGIILLAYSVFLIQFIELAEKLKKYALLSRFVKLNLEHNVKKENLFFLA